MPFIIKTTFNDDSETTVVYKITRLRELMKKSPVYKERPILPLLPWLIEFSFNHTGTISNNLSVKRIDIGRKTLL